MLKQKQPPVLKLNSAYMPMGLIHWQDAMLLYYNNKVEIVEVYDERFINSSSGKINYPAVIRLKSFVRPPNFIKVKKSFSRHAVWERDGRSCVYCKKPISLKEMTFDHVFPESKGGRTKWENIVSSCKKCNSSKAAKHLHETDFELRKQPYAPIIKSTFEDTILVGIRNLSKGYIYPEWQNYLVL